MYHTDTDLISKFQIKNRKENPQNEKAPQPHPWEELWLVLVQ